MGDDFFQGYDGGGSVAVGTGINDANAGFDWATLGQKASDLLAYGVKRKIDIASFRTLSQDQPDKIGRAHV